MGGGGGGGGGDSWFEVYGSLQQMAIVSQVKNFIDTHQVVCTGPFIYAYVAEVSGCASFIVPYSVAFTIGRLISWWIIVISCLSISLSQGTPNVKYFSKQMMLCKLARFLREAWVATVSV